MSDTLRPADLEMFKAVGLNASDVTLGQVRRVTHTEAKDVCGIRYRATILRASPIRTSILKMMR